MNDFQFRYDHFHLFESKKGLLNFCSIYMQEIVWLKGFEGICLHAVEYFLSVGINQLPERFGMPASVRWLYAFDVSGPRLSFFLCGDVYDCA